MDKMPVYLVFFQSLPETALLLGLGLALTGIKPEFKNVVLVSLLTSLASFVIRNLPIMPGFNVILQLPVLIGITSIVYKLPLRHSTIVSSIGLIGIFLLETPLNYILSKISGLSMKQVLSDPVLRLVFPLPEFLVLGLTVFLVNRKKIVLFDIQEFNRMERLNER